MRASRLLGLSASLSLSLQPQRSQAFVMESLAIASTVCSLIASRKKGDGGIGAMLTASIEYQRVMAQQLQDLQLGMAQVLTKVNALPAEIRRLLHEERLRSLQAEIGGSIDQYDHEVRAAAVSYRSYQEWAQNPLARQRMANISARLDEVISNISYGGWTDAVTSLYLPPALFASLGAMALLGESSERLKAEAQRYLDLMLRALDPSQAGSIGASLQQRQASFNQIAASLKALGVQLPPADQTQALVVPLGEVCVQHYVPAVAKVEKCRKVFSGGGGGKSKPEGGGGDNELFCTVVTPAVPEQVGASSGFTFTLSIEPRTVTDAKSPGSPFGVRYFTLVKMDAVSGASATATLWRAQAPSETARLAAAKASPAWRAAEDKVTKIRALIEVLNQDMAFLALNAGAMAALQAARSDVFAFFGKEV